MGIEMIWDFLTKDRRNKIPQAENWMTDSILKIGNRLEGNYDED